MNALVLGLVVALRCSDADASPCRLSIPDNYDPKNQYPLVLFLHGGAGRGTDNVRHLREGNGMLFHFFANKQFPALVMAPQTATEHNPDTVLALVDAVIRKYNVDGRRIYVVGQSLGGYGALDVLAARPGSFAAAVIIAAGGDATAVQGLSSVPMWFFHGERDGVIAVAQPRRMVRALRAAGGRPRYTEYKGEEHGLAWLVVRERELIPWLFAQRRPR